MILTIRHKQYSYPAKPASLNSIKCKKKRQPFKLSFLVAGAGLEPTVRQLTDYEPDDAAWLEINSRIKFLPLDDFSSFSLFKANCLDGYTSWYITFQGLNLRVNPFLAL